MDIPRQVRVVLAAVFVGGLGSMLVAGLIWAYTPERGGGLEFLPDTGETDGAADGSLPDPAATAVEDGDGNDGNGDDDGDGDGDGDGNGNDDGDGDDDGDAEDAEDAEEIIAAAQEPGATTVQVLDAGGGSAATQAVAATLGELGYNVVHVTSSRTDVERTTVWFTADNEPEARALRARDGRFAEVGPNERLNEATNLHVLVGPDWQD